ncbi:MAG TPA: CapA family protein [Ktedonobacterales bacterium]|nr:CapA family protein [Ktedonobacterales bacterium]
MRLLFVGDVMLGRLVNEALRSESSEYPWGDTLPLFLRADVRLCNLECVLSDRGTPWVATTKAFHFRSDARNIAVLRAARIDAVSLANNHTLDYGAEALADTLALLDAAGIQHAGAGRTRDEAAQPAITASPEGAIGLLSFTDNEPEWEATLDGPGTLYAPVNLRDARIRRLLESVSETRKNVDFLVVAAHWGPNWGYVPMPEHILLGHALIDAGADVVFGHSSHVYRGIEIYRGRPILYSVGNFIDDYAVDPVERNDQSCVFTLVTHQRQPRSLRMYPTVIEGCQARLAFGDTAAASGRKLRQLCAGLGTAATWNAAERSVDITLRP